MNFSSWLTLRILLVISLLLGGSVLTYSFIRFEAQKHLTEADAKSVVPQSSPATRAIASHQPVRKDVEIANIQASDIEVDVLAETSSSNQSLFSQLQSGVNLVAKMVIGGQSSLTYAGGTNAVGGINASALSGKNWASPGEIGNGTSAAGHFTTLDVSKDLKVSSLKDGFLKVNGLGEVTASRISLSSSGDVADRLPTASGGTGNDFSSTAKGSLLIFGSTGQMSVLDAGTSGYVLTSHGAGSLPTWQAAGAASVDWASPGTIGATTPNSAVFSSLAAGGGTTPFQIDTNGRLALTYNGDSGSLSSSGGAIFLNNTNNVGTGIGIYSNAGALASGNMINVKVDNTAYAQAAFYMNYDGSSNAVEIVSNSDDTSSNALAVTGNNINDSTVGIIGYELNRGTIKVSHYRPGTGNDSSASGISIDLKGSGTRAQGLYVDSTETGGTLGNLLRLRNESIDKFVVNYQGNLTMAGNIAQGAYGTDSTFTKYGNNTGDQFFVGTTGAFRVARSASNSEAFRVQVNGDSQGRWLGTSDGRLKWGDGSSNQDVTLRRGAAGILYLEGGIVFNNLNADYDTVIKGVNDSNLFFTDASTDFIGIGTSTPQAPLHVNKNSGGPAAVYVNQTGAGDLLGLSASGSARLNVTNAGNLVSVTGAGWRPTADAVVGLQVQNTAGTGFVTFDTSNSRVGIGTNAPGAALHVGAGDIWLDNNQSIRMKDSGGSARSILAYSSGNNVQLYNYAATGVLQIGLNNASNTSGNIRFFTSSNTERMRIDPAGVGIGATSFGSGSANVLAIASSTAPTTNITDGIQLFAVDDSGSHELRVRDEAGNVTTLSPHNFSAIPGGASDPMAWSFYSERNGLALSADMMKTVRLVESLSGQQLLYVKDLKTGQYQDQHVPGLSVSSGSSPTPSPALEIKNWVEMAQLNTFLNWTENLVTFTKEVAFAVKARFQNGVTVTGKTELNGPLQMFTDSAGQVTIPAGANGVKVTFTTPYEKPPTIYITPQTITDATFGVSNVSTQSFEVRLSKTVSEAVQLQWLAILTTGTQQAKTEVLSSENVNEIPVTMQSSAPVISATPIQNPVLGASDSAKVASESAAQGEN